MKKDEPRCANCRWLKSGGYCYRKSEGRSITPISSHTKPCDKWEERK